MSEKTFHNPYHFVPLSETVPRSGELLDETWSEKAGDLEAADSESGAFSPETLGPAALDRYHKKTVSGRLICRLTTKGPTVIGGRQESEAEKPKAEAGGGKDGPNAGAGAKAGGAGVDSQPAASKPKEKQGPSTVHPFEIDGNPAIPGSSLRGCISAVAEAASNSALRVLDDTFYSRRADVRKGEALSAIGMVVDKDGELRLLPLTYPTFPWDPKKRVPEFKKPWDTLQLPFKSYTFQKKDLPTKYKTFTHGSPIFVWGKYPRNHYFLKRNHVLGYRLNGLKDSPAPGFERGILRIFFTASRAREMPTMKKHEIFIPFPPGIEKSSPLLSFTENALENFEKLSREIGKDNERRAASGQDPVPFCLFGSPEFKNSDYALMPGDIVFFDLDEDKRVKEVSISQIWRKPFTDKNQGLTSAHSYFREVNSELLPFHPGRKQLTPAEAIFGTVEERPKGAEGKARSLASRIRFRDAHLVHAPEDNPYCSEHFQLMKILSTPKPPSPSFYFRKKKLSGNPKLEDCRIQKPDLSPSDHIPQGRKVFLHHMDKGQWSADPKTADRQNLRCKVRPLKEGCEFLFSVDVDNLATKELGLLAYAMSPKPDFRFKIGMGKPLGLGSVQVEIVAVLKVDRMKRYRSTALEKGTNGDTAWISDPGILESVREWNAPLARRLEEANQEEKNPLEKPIETFLTSAPDLGSQRECLERIGRTEAKAVDYPLLPGQKPEEESFKWFMENENQPQGQGLVPLDHFGKKGPPLPRLFKSLKKD